ncbi:MAG TPA: hypothetical protein ENI11_03220, partial [Actinobacteria bacterium]|nr:hypothetical protein [Actinomycetota bacterium]
MPTKATFSPVPIVNVRSLNIRLFSIDLAKELTSKSLFPASLFWKEASELILQQKKDQNKKTEAKIEDLKSFVARFSANASKAKQASSRKNLLDKLTLEDI